MLFFFFLFLPRLPVLESLLSLSSGSLAGVNVRDGFGDGGHGGRGRECERTSRIRGELGPLNISLSIDIMEQ